MPNKLRRARKKAVIKGRPRAGTFVDHKDVTDAPSATLTGTVNAVHRLQLKPTREFGTGSDTIFFKADKPIDQTSQYAVASTRLARFLGMPDMIAQNAFAQLRDVTGVAAGKANGVQLRTAEFDTEQIPPPGLGEEDKDDWAALLQYVKRDGKYYSMSELTYQWVDLSKPEIQKGLSDLQVFDAISGQADRHDGNIFVDTATGAVTGIDDDLSFGSGPAPSKQAVPFGDKYMGLPAQVDRTTAERILALNPADLPAQLTARTNDVRELTPENVADAQARLRGVQAHLRTLRDAGQLVSVWNDATYQQAVASPSASYTKRYAESLADAALGMKGDIPARVVGAPALPALPAPPQPVVAQPVVWPAQRPQPMRVPGPNPRTGRALGVQRTADVGDGLPAVHLPQLPALPPPGVGPGPGPARAALARLNAGGGRARGQVVTGARPTVPAPVLPAPVLPAPVLPDRPAVRADPGDQVVVLSDDLSESDGSTTDE
jgi:hypothetical protein